jgi:hypothetical protein
VAAARLGTATVATRKTDRKTDRKTQSNRAPGATEIGFTR